MLTTEMAPWALVSPASRGIGLEFARRLLQTTNVSVVATARKDLDQTKENVLNGLKDVKEDRINVLKVDFLGMITVGYDTCSLLIDFRRTIDHRSTTESQRALSNQRKLPPP